MKNKSEFHRVNRLGYIEEHLKVLLMLAGYSVKKDVYSIGPTNPGWYATYSYGDETEIIIVDKYLYRKNGAWLAAYVHYLRQNRSSSKTYVGNISV